MGETNVRDGVLCVGCGYDLGGLLNSSGSVCPECGLSMGRSSAGPLLRHEGGDWLLRVSDGLRQTHDGLYNIVLTWVGGIAATIIAMPIALIVVLGGFGEMVSERWIELLLSGTIGGIILLFGMWSIVRAMVGFWRATTPYRVNAFVDGFDWRRWARLFPLLIGASFAGGVLESFLSFSGPVERGIRSFAMGSIMVAMWFSYHAVRRHLSLLDGRCAGLRAYPVVRSYSIVGLWVRLAIVAGLMIFAYDVDSDDEVFALPMSLFLLAWIFLMRRFKLVSQRVICEDNARSDAIAIETTT